MWWPRNSWPQGSPLVPLGPCPAMSSHHGAEESRASWPPPNDPRSLNPLTQNMTSSLGMMKFPYIYIYIYIYGKNKKCSKPPTSWCFCKTNMLQNKRNEVKYKHLKRCRFLDWIFGDLTGHSIAFHSTLPKHAKVWWRSGQWILCMRHAVMVNTQRVVRDCMWVWACIVISNFQPKPTSSKFTFAVKDPPKFDRSYWGTCSWSRAFHRISCIFQQHQLRHMDPWCDIEVHWWGLSSIPSPVPVLWPLFGSARILRPATHAGCASFKGSSKRRKARQWRRVYKIPVIPIIHTMASSIIL